MRRNQPVLWDGLRSGRSTLWPPDHARRSISKRKKQWGRDDFTKIPNGIPSLEERIKLLYTHGVKTGRLDLHTFVNVASTQVAKNFRPLPAQRHDPARQRCRPRGLRSHASRRHFRQNAYDERGLQRIRGLANRRASPSLVTVRGEVAVRDGKFVGTIGRGQFLKRTSCHF